MTAPPPLRTDRLTLEAWTEPDFALLGKLARTPAVMRYIGDGTTWTDARIADVAAHISEHWRLHDFGWRVARVDGAPVGFIALNFAGDGAGVDPREYEIGWWLDPSAWGRGLAREGAAAVRDEAFERVGSAEHPGARVARQRRLARGRRSDRPAPRDREHRSHGRADCGAPPRRRSLARRDQRVGPRLASSSSARRTSLTRGRPIGSPSDAS